MAVGGEKVGRNSGVKAHPREVVGVSLHAHLVPVYGADRSLGWKSATRIVSSSVHEYVGAMIKVMTGHLGVAWLASGYSVRCVFLCELLSTCLFYKMKRE